MRETTKQIIQRKSEGRPQIEFALLWPSVRTVEQGMHFKKSDPPYIPSSQPPPGLKRHPGSSHASLHNWEKHGVLGVFQGIRIQGVGSIVLHGSGMIWGWWYIRLHLKWTSTHGNTKAAFGELDWHTVGLTAPRLYIDGRCLLLLRSAYFPLCLVLISHEQR